MKKKKLKIAVTGGFGTGKSTVCNFFHDSGYTVLFSDDIAKEILINDENVKERIIKKFGDEAYSETGLNTKFLAENVFSDLKKVKVINSIVHPPAIGKITELMVESLKEKNIVFVESALVFEAEIEEMFDYIILVTCKDDKKIDRIVEGGSVTEAEIKRRMENQIPDETKRKHSDFIIENNSTVDELISNSKFILNLLETISNTGN